MTRRWIPVGVVSLFLLSACTANEPERSAAVPVVLEAVVGSARQDVPSALDRIDDPALPPPLVDPTRVISGGPPPDGMLAPAVGRRARAYPVRIMIGTRSSTTPSTAARW